MIRHPLVSAACTIAAGLVLGISGHPQNSALFRSNNWLDKIPSVEVKIRPDGISVSTGPSRDEIFWTIGYIVLGTVLFILLSLAVGFCIYCVCWRERDGCSRVIVREIPVPSNSQFGRPISLARPNVNNVHGTQFKATSCIPIADDGISTQAYLGSQVKNVNGRSRPMSNANYTNSTHLQQPPPYRSRH